MISDETLNDMAETLQDQGFHPDDINAVIDAYTAICAREQRFIELGRRGANADTRHPDRSEWERLRNLINSWKEPTP